MAQRPKRGGLAGLLGKRPGVATDQIFISEPYRTPGPTGAPGAAGRDAGIKYAYSNNVAASDPGSGVLKFDSVTFASITKLRISETDGDTNTIFAHLATWDDSTSTIKGRLEIHKAGAPTPIAIFQITGTMTDNGTWDEFNVTPIAGALPANGDDLRIYFARTGDKGDQGIAGTAGTNGAAGPAGGPLPAARLATVAALPAYTRTANVLLANANGALPTIDGVAPAVNDLVLVVNGAAGADNGVYNVDALGSGAAKWQMTRYVSMDTSAELVPGMLVTVAGGNANADTIWQLTTDGPITLNTTALTFARKPKDFGLVTSLPANPVTGDTCVYTDNLTTPTYRWQLFYNGGSSSSFKWEVIGGDPLAASVDTSQSTTSATFADMATVGPSVTAPLAGDYNVTQKANIDIGTSNAGVTDVSIGGAAPGNTVATWMDVVNFGATPEISAHVVRTFKKTGAAAGNVFKMQYRRGTAGTAFFEGRRLELMPVRVG